MTPRSLSFDAFVLAAVVSELRHCTLEARVQKIQQPAPNELILHLYGKQSGAQKLLMSADPQQFRVHLTQMRRENPITPPGFCQVCRKYLEGAILIDIQMPRLDRVVQLFFRASDGETLLLIAELMGRNANVVLVSGTGTVRGVLRAVPSDSPRSLHPGAAYDNPPGWSDKHDPLTITNLADDVFHDAPSSDGDMARWLSQTFSGIGTFAAQEITTRASRSSLPQALLDLVNAIRNDNFVPHSVVSPLGTTIGVWAFAPRSLPSSQVFPRESVSVALDTFYATRTTQNALDREKNELARFLTQEISHREKERISAQATLAEASRAESYEQSGNNLLAQLDKLERGMASVTVSDLYDVSGTASVAITLDPQKSPHENAEAYFTRARKAREAALYAAERAKVAGEELAILTALSSQLEKARSTDELPSIREILSQNLGLIRPSVGGTPTEKPKAKPFGGYKIRTFTVEGYDLLIGESSEANDYLTTRVAAPTDLWMHVRSAPGAHGVLRTRGNPTRVPELVIRRAAEIVAARSGTAVKHAGVVAVDVVEKRHVRKPRGAKSGLVTYERERVLDVAPKL